MNFKHQSIVASGVKITIESDNQEIAGAYLYILDNDRHKAPFGLLENVFVVENHRKQGIGLKLIKQVIATARKFGCYKIIATSRYSHQRVYKFYERLGFRQWGVEFRINLKKTKVIGKKFHIRKNSK